MAAVAVLGWLLPRRDEVARRSATPSVSATATVSPSASPRGTGSVSPTPSESPADAARTVPKQADVTLSVLGDSTGNDGDEWVSLLAERLGRTRSVTLHRWDDARRQWLEPVRSGAGASTVTIWNFSAPGRRAAYPSTMIATAQPQRPDLVIYSFGHNNTSPDVASQLEATRTAVTRAWGSGTVALATLQNPELGASERDQAQVRAAVGRWADGHDYGRIDVARAFLRTADPSALMRDAVHPNPAGSMVWANTVAAALGL